ncbi:uncharacterized protein LOC105212754 isoform X1 [Zeugodacus cucurbitae]|uniref:uncharacterized protein LOC105212754 isoform X1 n=1 Tax=Zeugodacus cucurbitae TaxID=28588 RepID=UPI0023D9633A|nr:uncharacterized protein LOC105212754 isoform X1 [Zeugodacus cucurbitae]
MAKWLLVNKRILSAVVLCAFVLLQSQNGDGAPTHHLAVSVEGNTPTLIVTSAEIGITPKTTHTMRTTPPHLPAETTSVATERSTEVQNGGKGNAPKLKGKSHKLQYGKKWQYASSKVRDKSKEKGVSQLGERNPTSTATIKAAHADSLTRRVDNVAGIATTQKINTKTTTNTITTTQQSAQHSQENEPVPTTTKESMAVSSTGSLVSASVAVADKPSQVGSDSIAHDVHVSAPGAVLSAATGNLPQPTEVTTKPTGNATDSNTNVTAPFVGAEATRKTTLAEQVTATPTFVELHDTTAAATTTAPANGAAKKPISATTANVPMIAIQIETLPKAITVTTMSPATTTMITETVTSATAPATDDSNTNIGAHEAATTTVTTTEFPITEHVAIVSQSGPAMSTSTNVNPTVVSTVIERSSANVGDHLPPSPHPPTNSADQIVKQVAPVVGSTTTSTETVYKKNSLISTLFTTAIPSATTDQEPTKQTMQKVSTDGGIIFIDDVADNRDGKRHGEEEKRTEAALQRDEAVVDKHGDIKASTDRGDSVSDSEGIIKLIDLEKHDLKSIAKTKQFHGNNKNGTSGDDGEDGHDGVKKTRKKQLTDKHYTAVADMSVCTETHNENIATTGGMKTKQEAQIDTTVVIKDENKGHDNGGDSNAGMLSRKAPHLDASTLASGDHTGSTIEVPSSSYRHQTAEKHTTTMPILKPVHNGYLGPILMEEKRFTVLQANKKPHHQHETSIESQLRNGRIVEILAPTSLLEQTTVAVPTVRTFDEVSTTTTTPALPSAPVFLSGTADHSTPMLSTTVFQVPESMSSTTRLPLSEKSVVQQTFFSTPKDTNNERTESKISDIQVEVYDSTVDSIVASTNFKDSDGFYALPLEAEADSHSGTTKPPVVQQERFTQYVVDRADYATQESSATPQLNIASGKPEPAAIEIHINVSEGIGNESEDLEFSYRQPDYLGSNSKANSMDELMAKTAKAISMKPLISGVQVRHNESSQRENVERGDEILVVEIIDTGDNSTEGAVSVENINPIFTFRSDSESDVELKDIKYLAPEVKVKPPQISDELFLADLKKDGALPKPPLPPPPPPRKPTIDRDSDTIFYISNTEVKVGESLPTMNTNYEQQQQQKQQQQKLRKTRLENQFFPANYLASTHPNAARIDEHLAPQHIRYEEDIILSPVRNTADSLKIFRSQGDGAPPLDVTYVGESVMEVEQSSGGGAGSSTTVSTASASAAPSQMPDVIIQPAILPEMSIGVPVIGELPPQIELKEIDFMPDEANQQHSGMYENNMLEENGNGNGNDVDRLAESSIQYGGDLIDESAGGGGFDGVEGSYPFGNPVALVAHSKAHNDADYAHFTVNHGVSNLRKDELSVDVAGSGELMAGQPAAASLNNLENAEMKELLARSGNETFPLAVLVNGSYVGLTPVTERMSNATAYSVMEEPNLLEEVLKNHYVLAGGIFVVLLTIILTACLTGVMWFFYTKYSRSSDTSNANQANGSVANGKNIGEAGKLQEESTIDTTTSIPKQPLPSSNENLSNGKYVNAKSNKEQHSSICETNTTKPSSCAVENTFNGACDGAATFAIVNEKPDDLLLLAAERSAAAPSSMVVPSPAKPSDNNKSNTQANLSNNSVQENFTRPNGSVTKMTLKNNHLIVETEERHDISRVARETKMHYNNSEKDGVFVVEVARGVDSKSMPGSPVTEEPRPIYEGITPAAAATTLRTEDEKILRNHDEIQIHQPPPEAMQHQIPNCIEDITERSLHQIVELEEPALSPNLLRDDATSQDKSNLMHNSNTGLSQSDLSSTSSTDSNKRYSYGNQELYIIEPATYVSTSPSSHLPLVRPAAHNVGEDDDHRSENGHSLENSPAAQGNGSTSMNNDSTHFNELFKSELSNNEQNKENVMPESNMQASQVREAVSDTNAPETSSDNQHLEPTEQEDGDMTTSVVNVKKEEETPEVSPEADEVLTTSVVGDIVEVENGDEEPETSMENEDNEHMIPTEPEGLVLTTSVVEVEKEDEEPEANLENEDNEHMMPTRPEGGVVTTSVVEEIVEVEKEEVNLENGDMLGNEEENAKDETQTEAAASNDETLGENCVNNNNNNNILERTNEEEALNCTGPNIVLQSSVIVTDEVTAEDIHISPKYGVTNINVAHPAFPQPMISNYGYDSIISLPDPPSTEEIKQLADFAGLENNQLDSLPPPSPPPPPIAADLNDNNTSTEINTKEVVTTNSSSSTIEDAGDATPTPLKLKQLLYNNSAETSANELCQAIVTNGNSHDSTNGNQIDDAYSSPIDVNVHEMTNGHNINLELSPNGESNTGTVPETPLTPPESPPIASPMHYTNSMSTMNGMNGVNRGICGGPMPVAVDVNGS